MFQSNKEQVKRNLAEEDFFVGTFADTMEITPSQILTFLLTKFHEQIDPQRQRGYGMRFINAAKGILQFEYKKGVGFLKCLCIGLTCMMK